MINEITIFPGYDKFNNKENIDPIVFKISETISIVGATGSGKTALITDIELLAQGDTSTKRKILINGEIPSDEIRYNSAKKPIVMITQNTKCFTDIKVEEFLQIHCRARGIKSKAIVEEAFNLANCFTGEKIHLDDRVTTLSGGQTRALLIADAIKIGSSPIILLDEIENAGIFKNEVIKAIQNYEKIVIFVTHDPAVALNTDKRIVMENGGIKKILSINKFEQMTAKKLIELDKKMAQLREKLRAGGELLEVTEF